MKIEKIRSGNLEIAVIDSTEVLVTDVQSALDLMATVRYETECDRVVLNKQALAETFFILSSGLAGDVLQKFVNYQMKIAVYGDYSGYTSKPLRDFIYESNQGRDIFFMPTRQQAIDKLGSI